MKTLEKFGIDIPEILLPAKLDVESWSVIACDQHTQDRTYWQNVADTAAGKPSTLNLILPEVYLNDDDKKERIAKIRETMNDYLNSGVFAPAQKECIYIERTTAYGRVRHGLMISIDLDAYDWQPGSKALIRATEATVKERIPPRMEIRRGAPIESPHIMLLANDPDDILVGGTGKIVKKDKPAYDGDMMLKSGHITGWAVKSENALSSVEKAVETLAANGKTKDGSTFLFAVGDGNHSLATAKAVWEEFKAEQKKAGKTDKELANHPGKFALVEIVNIYDSGLTFEPIHRVLFNAESDMVIAYLQANFGGELTICKNETELVKEVGDKSAKGARFGFIYTTENDKTTHYELLSTSITGLAVSRLQPVLDNFISSQNELIDKANEGGNSDDGTKEIAIDYIHGSDEVIKLGKQNGTLGILLPPIAKDSFFATISERGPLPRKSFSMGEASEKRFYLECRKLF